ncbi:MAG: hypothetical protein PWP34_834 [Desulfuromonadales bacterium]|jgi:MSHA pilin protein MshA|nr:hypothetical protein [Desulfuromonadales bacterium]
MKSQSGFTLIELVVVIVVLGILAAVAVPKFVDLQGDAREAAVKGVAGNLASASALNYAAAVTNKTHQVTDACSNAVADLIVSSGSFGADASAGDYNVTESSGFPNTPALGDTAECTVTDNNNENYSADFTLIYVGS